MIEQIKQGLEAELQSLGSRTEARMGENHHDETGKLYFLGGKMAAFEKVEPWLRYLIGEVERLQEREFNHYPITILELESRIDGLQKALESCKTYLESSPTWNGKKYTVYHEIEQALERSESK